MADILKTIGVNSKGYGTIPKLVMQDNHLPITSKVIYAYFCSFAGAGEVCFPSRNKICQDLCISRETFAKYLKILKTFGYISVEQKTINGKFSHNVYTLVSTVSENTVSDTVGHGNVEHDDLDPNNNNKQKEQNKKISTIPTLPLVENVGGAEVVGGTKSDYDQYLEIIKKNIDYDCLIKSSRDSPSYKRQLDELINIIADVVTFRTKPINIGCNTYPAEMVKSQFLKLNFDNINYVMEYLMSEMPTITNPKSYLTTVLFNSRFNSSTGD